MTPRVPSLSPAASTAIRRRAALLRRERGPQFAQDWQETFLAWIEKVAANGAVMGTLLPGEPKMRSFPCKKQATILAEYTDTELRIIRVYFAGQDWLG